MSELEEPKSGRPVSDDRETRARLRRFRIVITLASLGGSLLLAMALIRFGVVPPGPFGWLVPGGADVVEYPVEKGALILEEPGAEKSGHRYLYDEQLGWRNIPNWKSTTFGRPLTINSKGLRDREYAYEKPLGVKRILVLGDSYAWGYGVADADVFTEKLEAALEGEAVKWEVINTGVSGWSTDQQYLFLRDEGLKYSPDVVLLAFCVANDFKGSLASSIYGLNKPLIGRNFGEFAGDPTALPFVNQPTPKPGVTVGELQIPEVARRSVMEALFGGISGLTTRSGAVFSVASFGRFVNPAHPMLKELSAEARSIVAELPGALYIDLDSEFSDRGVALPDLVDKSIEHEDHWDARGHRLVAEILEGFLREKGVLGASAN